MDERHVFTVTELNNCVKELVESVPAFGDLLLRGEVSNYKVYPSGHHYFTLKDSESALRCVMFKGSAMKLRFKPENGMQVIASGRISVYPRDGAYQLYCNGLSADGVGDLYVAFEQLKDKLYREGLFDPAHKKPLPKFPRRIAIVTSSAGAAVHDMIRILRRRYPIAKVILLPVRVQGVEAPPEIAGAIRYADKWKIGDVIITGRGGGSMEDLWAFNDEGVAQAIYDCETPVISAVGHEPDVTIADFVADLRAATPSNAAELAVPDQNELFAALFQYEARLEQVMGSRLERNRRELERLGRARALQDPLYYIQDRRMLLDYQSRRLVHGLHGTLAVERERFARLAAALDALSPLKVLSRGYALTTDGAGRVLASVSGVEPGDNVTVRLADGALRCRVEAKQGGENDGGKKEVL